MVSLVQFYVFTGDGLVGVVEWQPSTGFFETHGHFAAWVMKTPERQAHWRCECDRLPAG
jgi:hypothetical protein